MKLRDVMVVAALGSLAVWIGLAGGLGETFGWRSPAQASGPEPVVLAGDVPVALGSEGVPALPPPAPRERTKVPEFEPAPVDESADVFFQEVVSLLERGKSGYAELPALWNRAPRHRASLVRAVGQAGEIEGLRFLKGVFGQDEAVQAVLLMEIARLAPVADADLARDLAEPIRWQLRSGETKLVQTAAMAVGRLGDEESIPLLITLLEEGSGGMRVHATRALEAITGVSLRDDPVRWSAWYERENLWFEENVDELFEQLDSQHEEVIFGAVRGLAKMRLHRDETAARLLALLDHDSPSVRRIACQALGQLGSRAAVPPLIDLLVDDDEGVAQSAWVALRWLTGLELPMDHAVWRQAT